MTTTLTREALLQKAKPKYEEVEIPGYGTVGIRQQSELLRMRRQSQLFDASGNLADDHFARRRAYMLIDQVMVDESTPMFDSSDVDAIMQSGSESFDPLVAAVNDFNGRLDPVKNQPSESEDTSGS